MGIGKSTGRNGKISTHSDFMYIEWKIRDFFLLPDEADECVHSPSFQMEDANWCLCLYPNGQNDLQTAGYIDLLLAKEDSATSVHRVIYHIGINRGDGTVHKSWRGEEDFISNDKGWGVYYLMKRSVLHDKKRDLAPGGVVTFFCYLQVKSESSAKKITKPPVGVERLIIDFKNLLSSREDSDVTIVVKNQEFKVHKAILRARSSVFFTMFSYDMKEKNSGLVDILDCEPEVFHLFLLYLYSGCIENLSNDVVFGLYFIADTYDVEDLKTKCVKFLMDSLCTEIFCDVVSLSLRHNDSILLDASINFFAKNAKEIIHTNKWHTLLKDNPVAANELFLKILN